MAMKRKAKGSDGKKRLAAAMVPAAPAASTAPAPRSGGPGTLADIAEALGSLRDLYHLDEIGDMVNRLANALDRLASAAAMRVIAEHGSQDDREIALVHLKGQFENFRGR
jgi:hypothetical protein